jgi:hypothetical protein
MIFITPLSVSFISGWAFLSFHKMSKLVWEWHTCNLHCHKEEICLPCKIAGRALVITPQPSWRGELHLFDHANSRWLGLTRRCHYHWY